MVLYRHCRWNFNCAFRILIGISISGFGRHFRFSLIIGIWNRLCTLPVLFAMVECRRFAVGILMIYVHSFGDITTSGWLSAILDFRHELASAMIAGDLYVSYVVINSCIVFGTTCICKTSKVIGTSGNLAVILDYWRTSYSYHETGSAIRKFYPENVSVAVGILSLCALELNAWGNYASPCTKVEAFVAIITIMYLILLYWKLRTLLIII